MYMMRIALAASLAAVLFASLITWAQSDNYLPKEQHANGIAWISGGIGKEEADAMRDVASGYNLRLVFGEAQKSHTAFLSAVAVKITDAKGSTLLKMRSGPLLFLKLPSGHYGVTAEKAGRTITKSVRLKDKVPQEIALIWPGTVR